jgi:hypothetical protein
MASFEFSDTTASKVARKQCEWKHGGDTIGRMKTCRSRRNPLDGGGVLMEGTDPAQQRLILAPAVCVR